MPYILPISSKWYVRNYVRIVSEWKSARKAEVHDDNVYNIWVIWERCLAYSFQLEPRFESDKAVQSDLLWCGSPHLARGLLQYHTPWSLSYLGCRSYSTHSHGALVWVYVKRYQTLLSYSSSTLRFCAKVPIKSFGVGASIGILPASSCAKWHRSSKW